MADRVNLFHLSHSIASDILLILNHFFNPIAGISFFFEKNVCIAEKKGEESGTGSRVSMKTIVSFPAMIVLAIGLVFLSSWHLGFPSFMELPPSTWPIPYTSAFCLVLSGVSFFSLRSSSRFPLWKVCGFMIFFLGFQRTLELLFPADFRLNRLLCNAHFCPLNSQMVLSAAIGYMLVGVLFLYWPRTCTSTVHKIITLIISVPIIFLGSIGIFINLLPNSYGSILIHFYTAVGLFFIGLGFVIAKFYIKPIGETNKIG